MYNISDKNGVVCDLLLLSMTFWLETPFTMRLLHYIIVCVAQLVLALSVVSRQVAMRTIALLASR
jgi:hypothetical protein